MMNLMRISCSVFQSKKVENGQHLAVMVKSMLAGFFESQCIIVQFFGFVRAVQSSANQ